MKKEFTPDDIEGLQEWFDMNKNNVFDNKGKCVATHDARRGKIFMAWQRMKCKLFGSKSGQNGCIIMNNSNLTSLKTKSSYENNFSKTSIIS